jgi:hypothetical protein
MLFTKTFVFVTDIQNKCDMCEQNVKLQAMTSHTANGIKTEESSISYFVFLQNPNESQAQYVLLPVHKESIHRPLALPW